MLGASAEEGTLTIRWHAGETPDDSPEFAFHYSDSSGFDGGWHQEPNPHVEGLAYYRERETADDDYRDESTSFTSDRPLRILWDVLERLHDRLDM